jgi:hypothetical protein
MTSKQPVQTNSQDVAGVIPASPAIKDSPAVERALNRSKLYLLVSWSQLYPEDDEFLDYVQCGELVEDGRAALDALDQALDGIGGERAKLKLVCSASSSIKSRKLSRRNVSTGNSAICRPSIAECSVMLSR